MKTTVLVNKENDQVEYREGSLWKGTHDERIFMLTRLAGSHDDWCLVYLADARGFPLAVGLRCSVFTTPEAVLQAAGDLVPYFGSVTIKQER